MMQKKSTEPPDDKRLYRYAALAITGLGAAALVYVSARYLLTLLLPFLFSWAIGFAVRPLAHRLERRIPLPTRYLRAILAVLVTLGSMTLVGLFLWRVTGEVVRLVRELASSEEIETTIAAILAPLGKLMSEDGGELSGMISEAARDLLSQLLTGLGSALSAVVLAVPDIFLFLIVTVIGSLYFSFDLERINRRVLALLPHSVGAWLVRFKDGALHSALCFLRSYLILMGITFVLTGVGLLILRVEYALALALFIAILDALPVLGVGVVLVPWAVVSFLLGNAPLGIGLLVLYGVCVVLRQLIEPKIIGDSLGISPILSLILLYILYKIFSLWGLLLLPVFTVILQVVLPKEQTPHVTQLPVAKSDDLDP